MDGMEDEDIAAAMGFSSFGGTKKRKYDQTNSPKATVDDASGANTTRLGTRPQTKADDGGNRPNPLRNPEEDTALLDTSRVFESQEATTKSKTTQKQNQKEKQPAAGLAAFLSRGSDLPERPARGGEGQTAVSLPQDDPDATSMVSFGGPSISRAELNALRHGVRDDETGDTAYFLPSFVEDPWEKTMNERKGRSFALS